MSVPVTSILDKSPTKPPLGVYKGDRMPPLEFLQSARSKLHELYGPCAANSQVLVIEVATAQYQEVLAKAKTR